MRSRMILAAVWLFGACVPTDPGPPDADVTSDVIAADDSSDAAASSDADAG